VCSARSLQEWTLCSGPSLRGNILSWEEAVKTVGNLSDLTKGTVETPGLCHATSPQLTILPYAKSFMEV